MNLAKVFLFNTIGKVSTLWSWKTAKSTYILILKIHNIVYITIKTKTNLPPFSLVSIIQLDRRRVTHTDQHNK